MDEVRGHTPCWTGERLSLLLATNHLFGWTGSETLLLTLVESLHGIGCEVVVYVRHLDRSWAIRHVDPSVLLIDSLESVKTRKFDLAHVQHNVCLVDVRATFPTLPVLFSSLGILPFIEQPAPFEIGVSRFLAISEEVVANLVAQGVPEHKIDIVRNLVSGRRFFSGSPIRQRPERILVLSNKMDEPRKVLLRGAADAIGASIRFVGESATVLPQDRLVSAINEADIVVSLGRGVVEAMLCGRVPLVFDIHGGDGLVTPDNLCTLRTSNFSGRCYRKEYVVADLVAEFKRYRQEYGVRLREMALEQFGMERNLSRLLDIYAGVVATPSTPEVSVPLQQVLSFCSALAREDVQQCRRHQEIEQVMQDEIHRIKHTVSWRVTIPLRVTWNILRRLWRACQ